MAHYEDWLPRVERVLVDLMRIWLVVLADAAKRTAYGWEAALCASVIALIQAFIDARESYEADKSPEKRLAKDEAMGEAKAAMRDFANTSIRYNKKMSDADKLLLGIRPADSTQTESTVPVEGPESTLAASSAAPGVIKVRYHGAKPHGVDRVEIAWALSSSPAAMSIAQLTEHATFTRNPWEKTFLDSRGSTFYYALRYLVKGGRESPWSDIGEGIVP